MKSAKVTLAAAAALLVGSLTGHAQADVFKTKEDPMIVGDSMNTDRHWSVEPLITVGELKGKNQDLNWQKYGYRIPGLLDGIGAFKPDWNTVRLLVNHEMNAENGYPYLLKNGTSLTGARVSAIDIGAKNRKVEAARPAYDTIYDRFGMEVVSPRQINEGKGIGGFDRFCSSYGVMKQDANFEDDIYFTGEEVSEFAAAPADGFGGQEIAIDVEKKTAYVVPMLGRAAFENITVVDSGDDNWVGLVIGDDRAPAPLYLYLGRKGAKPAMGYEPPAFLVKNGLGEGQLYAWVADDDCEPLTAPRVTDPDNFNGTGSVMLGRFCAIDIFDPAQAGMPHYDAAGFASMAMQDQLVAEIGGFLFSRPEDVATNPGDRSQVVLASTGRGGLYGADNWGTTYLIDIDFEALHDPSVSTAEIPARIEIIYDGDDAGGSQFAHPDLGIRSPDNLDWADNGLIYINEDRSTVQSVPRDPAGCDAATDPRQCLDLAFGGFSGAEASLWQLDPLSGEAVRILEMDRSAVPAGQRDTDPLDLGDWESSGVLDVTELFQTKKGETLLVLDVQGHSLAGAALGSDSDPAAKDAAQGADLVEGGQLLLASKVDRGDGHDERHDDEADEDEDDPRRGVRLH